jgi:cell volume regulation protein A
MSELTDFAIIVLLVAGAFTLSILATQLGNHLPIPAPAVFLLAAALASDIWPALRDDISVRTVERIAVVALILVLLNGGMDIGWRRFRAASGPIMAIGIAGTFITAVVLTGAAHSLLGLEWRLAGVVGAALAPTDPAVMFSVLGRREIGGRSGTTLEGEAGVNDPAGVALMIGVIELATHDDATFLVIVQEFAVEMTIGLAFGLAAARLVPSLRRVRLPSEGLHPVFVATLAAALYAVTSLVGGSGFLAVFVAGLFLGDAPLPYKGEIERFQGSLAGLAEIVVFIALGLTIDITHLSGETWLHGVALWLVLAVIARPLTVALTLTGSTLSSRERAFIAFSGLKGAVPILLAAFAILGGVDGADGVYGLVFVVVLLSVLGQGTLVPSVARQLGIPMHEQARRPWQLSVRLSEHPRGVHEFHVTRDAAADGRAVAGFDFEPGDWVSLIVRDGRPLSPEAATRLAAGDRVFVLADPERRVPLERLFTVVED